MTAGPPPSGRRAAVRIVGWLFLFGLLGLIIAVLLTQTYLFLRYDDLKAGVAAFQKPGLEQVFVGGLMQVLGFAVATWAIGVRRLGLSWEQLRWRVPHARRGGALGLLLGAAAAGTALVLAVPAGGARWTPDAGTVADYAASVALTTAALAPAALSEEVIFRGVPLVVLAALLGRVRTIVAIAVLFALAHAFNANVTATGLGNIALAGVFLGVAFYAPGGLWTAFGAHLGWNATLAALDAPVSGLPLRMPLIDYDPGGPAWMTGGAFGPEGGLTATLAITLAITVAARWSRKESAT